MTDEDWKEALEIVLDMRATLESIKTDLTQIEQAFGRIEAHIAGMEQILASMNGYGPKRIGSVFGRIDGHLDRIEKRLGLSPLQV